MNLLYRLKQSVNVPGILYTIKMSCGKGRELIPHFDYTNINSIYPEYLKQIGIKGVLFDMDNTLSKPYEYMIHPSISKRFNEFKEGYEGKIAIISNSAGIPSDKHYEKARKIENAFGIDVIRHERKKPGCIDDVLDYFGIADPSLIAMIGDRVFTDVAFGNKYGMLTILVKPFTLKGDNFMAKLIRPYERSMMESARRILEAPEHGLLK